VKRSLEQFKDTSEGMYHYWSRQKQGIVTALGL